MDSPASSGRRAIVGEIIDGKYRVVKSIGKGGMGVVVEAEHVHLEHRVAIKLLRPEIAGSDHATKRFLREAKMASALHNEHSVRVFDVGCLPTGELYLVMEHLKGVDLGALLRKRGPLPIPEAVEYCLQACEALADAHAQGVVHRDLKPSNLFLTTQSDGSPLVKLLDFGLAKSFVQPDSSLTGTGEVIGSPHYMAPEQIRGLRDIDERTDIWGLGAILYKLLSGRAPFEAGQSPLVLGLILADEPTRLRDLRPDVPPALEALILRCLEKQRDKRLHDVAQVAEGLRAFAPERARLSIERVLKVRSRRSRPSLSPEEAAISVDAATEPHQRPTSTTAMTLQSLAALSHAEAVALPLPRRLLAAIAFGAHRVGAAISSRWLSSTWKVKWSAGFALIAGVAFWATFLVTGSCEQARPGTLARSSLHSLSAVLVEALAVFATRAEPAGENPLADVGKGPPPELPIVVPGQKLSADARTPPPPSTASAPNLKPATPRAVRARPSSSGEQSKRQVFMTL